MNSLVLFESQFGNTQKIAELIGKEFLARGTTRVASFKDYQPSLLQGIDLLVVGGPTQVHGMTHAMKEFLSSLESTPKGIAAAAFDTKLKGSPLLTGAASHGINRKLHAAGFEPIVEPESFLVAGKQPELLPGEEARAARWAGQLADIMATRRLVTA